MTQVLECMLPGHKNIKNGICYDCLALEKPFNEILSDIAGAPARKA